MVLHSHRTLAAVLLASNAAAAANYCATMTNNYNTEYTVPLEVGTPAQSLRVVPDSGSNDLLLDSTYCVNCMGVHTKYALAKSSSANGPAGMTILAYGQGEVECMEATDKIVVAKASASAAPLLLMTISAIDGFDESPYDGVMGLGRADVDDENNESVLKKLGHDDYSVCFGNTDGSAGRLEIGSAIQGGGAYVSLPAKGTNYWGVYLTSMSIGTSKVSSASQYAAIIDSGTSLIAVPTAMFKQIEKKVGVVKEDCSNQDSLPAVSITMGGSTFSLESKYYVVKTVDDSIRNSTYATRVTRAKAAGFGLDHLLGSEREVCQLAFFAMDEPTNEGDMIILGIPFLRAYAAHLSREGSGTISLSKVGAPTMCTTCEVGGEGSLLSTNMGAKASKQGGAVAVSEQASLSLNEIPSIPVSRLHLPFWLKSNSTNATAQKVRGAKPRDAKGRLVF